MAETREELLQRLRQDMKAIDEEGCAVQRSTPIMTPEQWEKWSRDRQRNQEAIRTRRFKNAEAWDSMFWDAVEMRYFIAKRRWELAWYGLREEPRPYRVVIKDQPEQLGVMLIVSYRDALAAIEPRHEVDAMFVAENAELFLAYATPAKAVAKWLAKREAAGDPYVPGEAPYSSLLREDALTEFKLLRDLLYPTKEALAAARSSKRLWSNPQEDLRETLETMRARLKAGDKGGHFCRCGACGQLIVGAEREAQWP